MDDCSDDIFKASFKYYKSKKPKPSLDEVLSGDTSRFSHKVTPSYSDDPRTSLLGLNSLSTWSSYTFENHPGLILIRNPFTTAGQRYWIKQCLEQYPKRPNKKNIDFEMEVADWWNECYRDGSCNKVLRKKLRWTTLGYHHDWDTKVYNEENQSPFPSDLAELSDVVAQYLGLMFKAEAAIVNYYHMDSTLAPHTDHSECNLDAPLFSFSFGQSAIFLIGGEDKSVKPSAILLQSGDIVVMSKQARICYHAVPKILPADHMPWLEDMQHLPRNNDIYFDRNGYSFEVGCEIKDIFEEQRKNIEIEASSTNESETNKKLKKNFGEGYISKNLTDNVHTSENQNGGFNVHLNNNLKIDVRLKYLNASQVKIIMNAEYLQENWQNFADYLTESRINMNVRQVLYNNQKCLDNRM